MAYKYRVAVIYLLGFFIDLINMFMASVAFPDIGRSLHASIGTVAWVANAYTLGLTLVIPLSAWLAERFGGKAVFVASLGIFLVAVTGAGCAASIEALIAWRFLQGLGGGLLIPLGQTMSYRLFDKSERARLSAAVMATALLAPALSPLLGGLVVDTLGWHWMFFLNIPLTVLTLALAVAWLKEGRSAVRERPDLPGMALIGAALALVLYGLSRFERADGWTGGAAFVLAGLAALAGFLWHARRAAAPVLDLAVLRDPLLRTAMLVYLFVPGVFTGIGVINIFFVQSALHMSAIQAGALMLPYSAAAFVSIGMVGRLFNRVGPRTLLLPGVALFGLGIATLLSVSGSGHGARMVAAFLLMGFGGGIASSTAQTMALLDIGDAAMAKASAIWNLNRQLCFCVGVAVFSLMLGLLLARAGIADLAAAPDGGKLVAIFHLCFAAGAASTLIPLLAVARIDNRGVLATLHQAHHPSGVKND
ncbi:MFS transporter [Janthinobacterium fluminis]|uniref:MFS transporter n=1 Tax=Janthinobacterium fluminis TaxID=2987524 RepID=A0ABT5K1Q0_9BURK|nr:MFS transporter [Janthinobacterium fluminis]MDC8758918.1 MFS transporter [Janthinobacterium fluminis]